MEGREPRIDMKADEMLRCAVEKRASDIFLIPGLPLSYKMSGRIEHQTPEKMTVQLVNEIVTQIYDLSKGRQMDIVESTGDDDFSFAIPGLSRFRANIFKQRGSLGAVLRVITFELPKYEELGIPRTIIDIANEKKGFVLVTGSAGSGKSTTLSCIIDAINHTQNAHVITIEDPIEFLHLHDKSVITQREIGLDTESYESAMRAALRQAPDVILLGEMRDFETIKTAMTAAETGHLVISTLHTIGAANTIDRIIDTFPPNQQQQIRIQLSMVLRSVISQQLVPTLDGKEVPAFEIMFLNNAIRNMIRESKIHQIDSVIQSGAGEKMISMDTSLLNLFKDGKISKDTALIYSSNPELMEKRLARG